MTEKRIEIDTNELKAGLAKGLSPEEIAFGKNTPEEDEEPSFDMAATGVSYKIGPLDIVVSMGNLALLNEIESPFVAEELAEGQEITFNSAAEALYVIAKGFEAAEPIMNIKQKQSEILMIAKLFKDNPAAIDKALAKHEEISNARVKFTENAIEFYNTHFSTSDFENVMIEFQTVLYDALLSLQDLPKSDSKNTTKSSSLKKKKTRLRNNTRLGNKRIKNNKGL